MADEFRAFGVTVPAGTAIAAPQITALPTPIDRLVTRIEMRVPPGCNGLVGFALQQAHQSVIPYGLGQWIITNDEIIGWDIGGVLSDGDWSIAAYNTGSFAHTLQIRLLMVLAVIPVAPILPIAASELSGVVS